MNYDVKLLSTGINEIEIARYTRICYGKFGEEGNEEKTLKNLIGKEHLTPFEMSSMTFKIKCPIYVQRQIMRHRTGSFLEKSLRYTKNDPEFGEGKDNFNNYHDNLYLDIWQKDVKAEYKLRLKESKPEDARKVLTLDTLTEFIFHIDLRNLMHFFTLRLSKHTQKETQQIAKDMFVMFCLLYPKTAKAFAKKEAKVVAEAFTEKEMGEIWPLVIRNEQPRTAKVNTEDSGNDRNVLPNDTFVSEEKTETKRVVSEGFAMDVAEYYIKVYGRNNS
jgi:thymidylate synthase (FAD)